MSSVSPLASERRLRPSLNRSASMGENVHARAAAARSADADQRRRRVAPRAPSSPLHNWPAHCLSGGSEMTQSTYRSRWAAAAGVLLLLAVASAVAYNIGVSHTLAQTALVPQNAPPVGTA